MTTIEDVKKIKNGDILNTSWGYDMTINDYCKVMENTGKTIKCQKIGKILGPESHAGNQSSVPDKSRKVCKPFRIRISRGKPNINDPGGKAVYLVGSYPFATEGKSADCDSKRQGSWRPWDKTPDYENTYD